MVKKQRSRIRPSELVRRTACRLATRRGFGINEVIGVAAGIIVAVLVVIPGIQTFAGDMIDRLGIWWGGMADGLFTP